MGRYLVQPDPEVGPGGDVVFRKHPATSPAHDGAWVLYVGEKVFGTILPMYGHTRTFTSAPRSWTAISNGKGNELIALRMMDGFASRWHAAVYIIKHHGYWLAEERKSRRDTAWAIARTRELAQRRGLVFPETQPQVPINPNPIAPAQIGDDGSILVVTTDNKLVRYVPDV